MGREENLPANKRCARARTGRSNGCGGDRIAVGTRGGRRRRTPETEAHPRRLTGVELLGVDGRKAAALGSRWREDTTRVALAAALS